jgi:hypothetical protein
MKSLSSVVWQDYRASEKAMVIVYTSDPVSEIPIREVPESIPSDVQPEPNYETGTYGFYGCINNKIRATFVKSKLRYLVFMTKYVGTNLDFEGKMIVTGFYRITKNADVHRFHIRNLAEFGCLDDDVCHAVRGEEIHFVSLADAFDVTPEVLKKWGVTSRVTRQSRILLDEAQTSELLTYLRSKDNAVSSYIEETTRLSPSEDDAEEESE